MRILRTCSISSPRLENTKVSDYQLKKVRTIERLGFMNITRVSVDSANNQANEGSREPSISPDGRFIAFQSKASNLVRGDTNDTSDIFVRDTLTNTTTRVSVDSAGNQADDNSSRPSISTDGRFVAFNSLASNLAPGDTDTNYEFDIFVRDTLTNTTTRVSVDSAGNPGDNDSGSLFISANGRFVVFESLASNLVPGDTKSTDIFVRDTLTNTTISLSADSAGTEGPFSHAYPSISSDGRFGAFASFASKLVPGDTNDAYDIFVRDTLTNTTTRVSVDSGGNQALSDSSYPSISANGRFVAFESIASNLVPEDTNDAPDIFVRDTLTNTTTRVSVDSAGNQGNNTSVDQFPYSGSNSSSISGDGRFVAFESMASNLVPEDTNDAYDIFVRDRLTNTTTRVSVDSAGNQALGNSSSPSISANGRFVVFNSSASNLVPGDTNDAHDIFVRDTLTNTTTRVSVDSASNQAFDNNINSLLGTDNLSSTRGNDIFNGVGGNDVLIGLRGNDVFVLDAGLEVDTIADFAKSQDTVQLIKGLNFGQLSISPETESSLIKVGGNGEVLAFLIALLLVSWVLKISSRSRV
jgi:Tol biopolymer transport system component